MTDAVMRWVPYVQRPRPHVAWVILPSPGENVAQPRLRRRARWSAERRFDTTHVGLSAAFPSTERYRAGG